jgi:hypothetical protein
LHDQRRNHFHSGARGKDRMNMQFGAIGFHRIPLILM